MIDYYISSIQIETFRGIKALELDFDPQAPTILIGPNNSGKSTVLDAIGLCLGSPKFSKYLVTEDDFWRGAGTASTEEFTVNVRFKATDGCSLPAVKGGVGDPIEVHGIRGAGSKGSSGIERYLLDENGEQILLMRSTPVSKGKQDTYKGMGFGGKRYARTYDLQKWLPEVWQLDSKNLFLSLYHWKTGPLQRLLAIYKDKLFSEEWTTTSGRPMPHILSKLHSFLKDEALQSPFWKNSLSFRMAAKFKEYLGERTDLSMSPALNAIDSWILSELQIQVAPAHDLAAVDCRHLGDGWQSLIRLAALELAIEFSTDQRLVVLLFEEPETYLHPHLRRRLRTIFQTLQVAGYQSMVTTHSPELISFSENQQILRVLMSCTGVKANGYTTQQAGEALKVQEKLYERGNHEMVFANCAILAEGKPDQYAIRFGLEKIGRNCDIDSISIVDCGGVGNLPDYAKLCTQLGIPWIAIHDKDIQADGTQKETTRQARLALDALKGMANEITEWDNDLEEVMGYRLAQSGGKLTTAWINEHYGSLSWEAIENHSALSKYSRVIHSFQNYLQRLIG